MDTSFFSIFHWIPLISSNGTFVNGEKIGVLWMGQIRMVISGLLSVSIGKNKKQVLNSDAEISLSTKNNKGEVLL